MRALVIRLVMFISLTFVYTLGVVMTSVSIRIDEELKEEMAELKINWSDYIREAIRKRVELEKRRGVARKLLEDLERGVAQVPEGFIARARSAELSEELF